MTTFTKKQNSKKLNTQIRINRTDEINSYLSLARVKYKTLDDNEIIKVWIGKGISEDFKDAVDNNADNNILAKQALTTFSLDEDDQEQKANYRDNSVRKIKW